MPGKRKKDPEINLMREALEGLFDVTEDYRESLETELAAARTEPDPYLPLIRALESQIASVSKMETLLDDQAWPLVIRLGHGSSYVEHARTRDYF